jgi:hypothetical protein
VRPRRARLRRRRTSWAGPSKTASTLPPGRCCRWRRRRAWPSWLARQFGAAEAYAVTLITDRYPPSGWRRNRTGIRRQAGRRAGSNRFPARVWRTQEAGQRSPSPPARGTQNSQIWMALVLIGIMPMSAHNGGSRAPYFGRAVTVSDASRGGRAPTGAAQTFPAPSWARRRCPTGGHASIGCSARVSSGARDPSRNPQGSHHRSFGMMEDRYLVRTVSFSAARTGCGGVVLDPGQPDYELQARRPTGPH